MEIDAREVGVIHHQRSHRTRQDCGGRVGEHDDAEKNRCGNDLAANARGAGQPARAQHAPEREQHDNTEDERDVLPDGQQRDHVERVRDRREHEIAERPAEVRFRDILSSGGIANGRNGKGAAQHDGDREHKRERRDADASIHRRRSSRRGGGFRLWRAPALDS